MKLFKIEKSTSAVQDYLAHVDKLDTVIVKKQSYKEQLEILQNAILFYKKENQTSEDISKTANEMIQKIVACDEELKSIQVNEMMDEHNFLLWESAKYNDIYDLKKLMEEDDPATVIDNGYR